jgi:hypothetical protein
MPDPNRIIRGDGWAKLQEANIGTGDFDSDFKAQIQEMNRDFIRHHKNEVEVEPSASSASKETVILRDDLGKEAAAEFLRLVAGQWCLRFARRGKQVGEERCRIDSTGGYYLLDRRPGSFGARSRTFTMTRSREAQRSSRSRREENVGSTRERLYCFRTAAGWKAMMIVGRVLCMNGLSRMP